jgi:hypothetical protein
MKTALLVLALVLMQGAQGTAPGSIEGVVVRQGTSTPVARARVGIPNAAILTDENGRFSFQNVPAGRYRLSATHNAYVVADAGKSTGNGAVEVTVSSGQSIKGVVLALVPKGAISGRVVDKNGDPVTNATVQAMKYTYQDGHRILVPVDNARTNDRGEYRLFWLAPGPYVISAAPQESPCADAPCTVLIENRNAVSGPPPVIGGNVRLDGRVAVRVNDGIRDDVAGLLSGYDRRCCGIDDSAASRGRFYRRRSEAHRCLCRACCGRVVNGVTGQAVSAANAGVSLMPRRGTVSTGSSQRAFISNNGTFEFRHIAPGSYDLVATISNGAERLAASQSIEIGNRDIDAVTLVLQPQLSITGRLAVENLQAENLNMSAFRIELRRDPILRSC